VERKIWGGERGNNHDFRMSLKRETTTRVLKGGKSGLRVPVVRWMVNTLQGGRGGTCGKETNSVGLKGE